MTEQGRKFVIAGAGIAGLTMALALAKFGASVTVIERRDTIGEFGAGLQISSNARRILERLGAGRFLLPRMHVPPAIDVYPFRRKKPIVSLELGKVVQERFGAPYGVIHRGDLVEALHQACKRFATIDILFGVHKVDFAHHARGFSVMIEEADGKSRTIRPFAYIGADGVHSATRTDLDRRARQARYTGYTAWRKLVDFADMPEGLHKANTSLLWGPEFHGVVYPLPPHKAANVVMFTRLSEKKANLVRDGKRGFQVRRARCAIPRSSPASLRADSEFIRHGRFTALRPRSGTRMSLGLSAMPPTPCCPSRPRAPPWPSRMPPSSPRF